MTSQDSISSARKRLLGTWRSDRDKTIGNWVFPKRIASKKYRWFASIFGHLAWHFTPKYCYQTYKGRKSRERYKVIWASQWSAVVVFAGSDGKQSCHHLFFEGRHFYLCAGRAGNAEYFKHARQRRAFPKRRA